MSGSISTATCRPIHDVCTDRAPVVDVSELRLLQQELQRHVTTVSARLIRQLKHRDRRHAKQTKHCDVITAVLQASSLKRREYSYFKR